MADRPVVAYSERLGSLTDTERRLETEGGAEIRRVSLWSADDAHAHANDADIVMVGAVEPVDARFLAALASCRLLVRRGVGVDNVDVVAATALGIPVAFVPDASVEEVSEHALSLLLAIERRLVTLDGAVRKGAWARDTTALGALRQGIRRMNTLTLGIVGFGRIGRALARKAGPLYGSILVSDPYVGEGHVAGQGVSLVGVTDLFERSDHVSIHSPLTDETYHLVDTAMLARMRPGSVLVNTSRGGLIDEGALVAALTGGRISGAGLDVNEVEPLPADSPLWLSPNVILTGHSAASSASATEDLRRRAVDAALLGLAGQEPPALADPDVLQRPNTRLVIRPG